MEVTCSSQLQKGCYNFRYHTFYQNRLKPECIDFAHFPEVPQQVFHFEHVYSKPFSKAIFAEVNRVFLGLV
jgi:hypothetical protein